MEEYRMSPVHRQLPSRPITAIRLDGGRPCLDLVNSIHDRYAAQIEDYLRQPQRFIEWCARAGVLRPDEGVRAPHAAYKRAELMREVVTLRRHLHALFAARIDHLTPPPAAVRGLDSWVHRAWDSQSLGADGHLHWRAEACDAWLPLKRVALDALGLLGEPSSLRLRRCANTTSCGWLYLDTSKNQRRRWCAMETCGIADKMRRYRQR
jgi:predicted RNA-binding Zn ribbon-like protein